MLSLCYFNFYYYGIYDYKKFRINQAETLKLKVLHQKKFNVGECSNVYSVFTPVSIFFFFFYSLLHCIFFTSASFTFPTPCSIFWGNTHWVTSATKCVFLHGKGLVVDSKAFFNLMACWSSKFLNCFWKSVEAEKIYLCWKPIEMYRNVPMQGDLKLCNNVGSLTDDDDSVDYID